MTSPIRFVTAAVLMLSLTNAFAGEAVDRATRKLENVINNSVALDQRGLLLSKSADVRDAIESLNVSLRKLENVVNNNLPAQQRAQLHDQIADLKSALASELADLSSQPQPQPQPTGLVCMAACKSISGLADMNYTAIGKGEVKLIAAQKALDALRATYNCSYGAIEAGCEQEASSSHAVTCQQACKSINGQPDMNYTAIGQASTELEALQKANVALKEKFSCSYGAIKVTCERH